jgi:hypothetical protein
VSAEKPKAPTKVCEILLLTDIQRKAAVSEDEDEEDELSSDQEDPPPPKKKAKANPPKAKANPPKKPKPKQKSAPLSKARISSPAEDLESSDDDMPLRPGPSDTDIKGAIRDYLHGKDLSLVTKGMVKEALRKKYGDETVKSKRELISQGIAEGMDV